MATVWVATSTVEAQSNVTNNDKLKGTGSMGCNVQPDSCSKYRICLAAGMLHKFDQYEDYHKRYYVKAPGQDKRHKTNRLAAGMEHDYNYRYYGKAPGQDKRHKKGRGGARKQDGMFESCKKKNMLDWANHTRKYEVTHKLYYVKTPGQDKEPERQASTRPKC